MMESDGGQKQVAIQDALHQGLVSGAESAERLERTLKRCAADLRIGPSHQVLEELTEAIGNLALVTELVEQMSRGLLALNVEGTPLSRWHTSAATGAFEGVVTALEAGDWVFLADLLEYEICPLVAETGAEMSLLLDGMRKSAPVDLSTADMRQISVPGICPDET